MGTVVFGQTSDHEAAEELARRYYPYDPYKVKKSRTIYASASRSMRGYRESVPVAVGDQTTEFTRNEQNYINSRPFLELAPLHFLIGQSRREGELPRELREIDLEELDPGQFPERSVTDPLREALMCRDGVQESQALREIAARLAPPGTTPAAQEEETAAAVAGEPVLKEPAAETNMPGCISPIRSARARQPRPRSGRPEQS
jgi:hypothetical protein